MPSHDTLRSWRRVIYMKKISKLLDNDIKLAIKEVRDRKSATNTILNNLHKKILECRDFEKQVFEKLDVIFKN